MILVFRRRGAAVIFSAALLAALNACGGPHADLFVVERDGTLPAARLTLLISNGGTVTCNRGEDRALTSAQLIDAREIARDLNGTDERDGPADSDLRLAPGPGAIMRYEVRSEDGAVAFSDTSRKQPQVFFKLARLTRDIAKDVCRLPR